MVENLTQIEKYLTGQLTQEETASFESRLENDAALSAEVERFKVILGGIRLRNNRLFKDRLNEIHDQEFPDARQAKIKPLFWRRILAIAASILIVLTVYFVIQSPANDPAGLYADYFEPYHSGWNKRNGEHELKLNQLKELYESKDYPAVVEFFSAQNQEAIFKDSKYTMVRAISLMETNQYALARQYLDQASENPLFQSDANWYKALSYLKEGDLENCRSILEQFIEEKNKDYQTEAGEILNKLK